MVSMLWLSGGGRRVHTMVVSWGVVFVLVSASEMFAAGERSHKFDLCF